LPGGGIAIDRRDPVSLRNAHHRRKRCGHHRLFISLPSNEVSQFIEHAANHARIDIHHQVEVVDGPPGVFLRDGTIAAERGF